MPDAALPLSASALPHSLGAALARGARGRCPRCGGAHLFASFVRPVERCGMCGQNWTLHAADDFPAYLAILITGHVMAPVIIALGLRTELSLATMMGLVAAMALVLLVGLLRPAKGAIIAFQWWMGMHGFAPRPGRREAGRP
ncbi:DUF983 domain-containing protein [Novosphingobium huizhouense]|uniref:DUF983 domain-containing protein n=1 Tax=Novosphingobium huizhouense TaxID=2866625 RepID=UPI001CD8750D|nr:DUF983 domain-containing protein [Novosphingobium huizhouense]